MTVTTIKVRGEDIRAGQYVILNAKAYRVLRNDRARRGGDGVLKLKCNWSNPWRGYRCRDTFKTVTRPIK